MNTQMKNLIKEIKSNGEDMEFYPTKPEMIKAIYNNLKSTSSYNDSFDKISLLDIGAGNGIFYNNFILHNPEDSYDGIRVTNYSVIEKSKTLVSYLPANTNVIGIDFKDTILIDKPFDVIFCNPPYSEYKEWTCKILEEGCFKVAYLIIPERWKNSKEINSLLNDNIQAEVIYTGDFLDAERQARANVDIIKFTKDMDEDDVFYEWFNTTFKVDEKEKEIDNLIDKEQEKEEQEKNEIVSASNKIDTLLELYNNDVKKLQTNISYVMQLDATIFKELNIDIYKLAMTLKEKLKNLKIKYWNDLFEQVETIRNKLTSKNRRLLFSIFQRNNVVDFNLDNIYSTILWVCKNAEVYYNKQLTDFFKDFTEKKNLIKYKSNKKTFSDDNWRFNQEKEKLSHYKLDYRIIQSDWTGMIYDKIWDYENECKVEKFLKTVNDTIVIANNGGFNTKLIDSLDKDLWGKKQEIFQTNGDILFEFKVYKNGNIHYKFNLEFCKYINIESARLLGWIKNKKEVVEEMGYNKADAEKYYNLSTRLFLGAKSNMLQLTQQ